MRNICFLLGNVQGNGGIARVVSIIANELCKNDNYRITLISYCPAAEPAGYAYSEKIEFAQLYSERIPMTKAILAGNAVGRLKKTLAEAKADVLIACGALYFPLAVLAAAKSKAKCFCWEHSDPAGTSDHKFQMLSRKIAVKKADKIIVLTKAAREYYDKMLGAGEEKLLQIYNPVSNKAANSAHYDAESKKILSVGRLTYQKNFQLLVEIAETVLAEHSDWMWDICGEGEDRAELEKMIEGKGLETRLFLRGQVKDIYQKYREYAFLVMTSRYEGFPMSLIEGAANRLPLVAFDVPTGPAEIISDGENGYLIEADKKELMTGRICALIENAELRKRMSARAYEGSKSFELKGIIKTWEGILTEN